MNFTNYTPGLTPVKGKITNEQWNTARPLIQRLYMDENKPFSYVADAIKSEFGFCPTKRQFDRRVSGKWKLRKNASVKERMMAVRQLESTVIDRVQTSAVVRRIDRPLNATKLKRWKRELGRSVQLDMQLDCSLESYQPIPVSSTQLSTSSGSWFTPVPLIEEIDDQNEFKTIWDSARITESPGLTALFSAFRISGIELSDEDIPPILLTSLDLTDDAEEESEYLSASDLINLQTSSMETEDVEAGYAPSNSAIVPYRHSRTKFPSSQVYVPSRTRNQNCHVQAAISPFNELYFFTNNQPLPFQAKTRAHHQSLSFLEEKLQKLGRVLPRHHDLIIRTLNDLSSEYKERGLFTKAVNLSRVLLSTMEEKYGYDHYKTLESHLGLAYCLQRLDRHEEAREIIGWAKDTIAKLYPADYELLCQSMAMVANDKYYSDDLEEAERIEREVLQMKLNFCGPKDKGTLKSLFTLGVTMRRMKKTKSAEQIFRCVIQLLDHVPGNIGAQSCQYFQNLSGCLSEQGKRSEASLLFAYARKHARSMFSDTHYATLSIEDEFADHLDEGGDYQQSCEILKDVVIKRRLDLGGRKDSGFTSVVMVRIGAILLDNGIYDEAVVWIENSVLGLTEYFGSESQIVLGTYSALGVCYQEMGAYRKALSIFADTFEKNKNTNGKILAGTIDLEEEIAMCQQALAAEQSSMIRAEEIFENEDEDGDQEMGNIYSEWD